MNYKPGIDYLIYTNPDMFVPQNVGEKPNLYSNEDILYVNYKKITNNKDYVPVDSDGDGIPDSTDNCLNFSNPKQEDENKNGRGDVCDDYDRDGAINGIDNCVNDPNYNQADIDGDKIGDICDQEESRITEKYPWIVWGAIIFAFLVFIVLFSHAVIQIRKKNINNQDLS
jgi:hypothetical protein